MKKICHFKMFLVCTWLISAALLAGAARLMFLPETAVMQEDIGAEEDPDEVGTESTDSDETEAGESESTEEGGEEPEAGEQPEDTEEAEDGTEEGTEEELEEPERENGTDVDAQDITVRQEDLGNWTNYNGLIFGNADLYETTSGGGLAVAGNLQLHADLQIGSTYTSEYDATRHIGEYKNEERLPALLYGGRQISTSDNVQQLQVYGGAIAMSPVMLEENAQMEPGFMAMTDSGYESVTEAELEAWFAHQYEIVSATSRYLDYANDRSISLEELGSGAYLEYGPEYFQNQFFEVNGEVYDRALVITVRSDSDLDFGQWWPVQSILTVDVNWALDYELVIFDFPDAVNVTMNSSAFSYLNTTHWSTTSDAWIGETGMAERKALAEKVIYNFPAAQSVQASQALIQGSILAPEATFTGIGVGGNDHIYGHIIAKNYVAQGNFTIHAFHLTHWIYDLVDDALREQQESSSIRLRQYLFFRDQATSVRLEGGSYRLEDEAGNYYMGDGKFTDDPELAAQYETSAETDVVIADIPAGTYTLRALKAPAGCLLNDYDPDEPETWYEIPIILAEGVVQSVVHYAEPAVTDMVFQKTDAATGAGIPGAVFAIVREADEYEDTTTGSRYVSDADGTFTSHSLPVGSYQMIEVEIPDGYEAIEDGAFSFEVYWDEAAAALKARGTDGTVWDGTETDPVPIENKAGSARNTLTVVKYANREAESGISYTLAKAVFALFRYDQAAGWQQVTEAADGTPLDLVTNELGYVRLQDLEDGVYRLVELEAPPDYQKSNTLEDAENADVFPEGYAYECAFGSASENNATAHTAYIKNTALQTDVRIDVYGILFEAEIAAAGAVFRLERRMQQGNAWEEVFHAGTTDEQGQVLAEGLEAGAYRLTQTKAADGWAILDPGVITFDLYFEEEQPVIEALYNRGVISTDTTPVAFLTGAVPGFRIFNQVKTRAYAVYKTDADYEYGEDEDGSQIVRITYLEGAVFRLRRRENSGEGWRDYGGSFTSVYQYAEDGTPVLDSYGNHVTEAVFEDGLIYGEYQLIEIQTPPGYTSGSAVKVTLDDGTTGRQIHQFTITESMTGTGMRTTYTAADYARRFTLPFTGGWGFKTWMLCGSGLLIMAAVMIMYRKKRKRGAAK